MIFHNSFNAFYYQKSFSYDNVFALFLRSDGGVASIQHKRSQAKMSRDARKTEMFMVRLLFEKICAQFSRAVNFRFLAQQHATIID